MDMHMVCGADEKRHRHCGVFAECRKACPAGDRFRNHSQGALVSGLLRNQEEALFGPGSPEAAYFTCYREVLPCANLP